MFFIYPILTLCYTSSVVFMREWKLALLNCVAFLFIEVGIFLILVLDDKKVSLQGVMMNIVVFYIIPFGLCYLVSRLKFFARRPWLFVLFGPILFYSINIWAIKICKIYGYKL